MKLFHSQNILDLSAFKKLPRGTIKDIMIRFTGTNKTGQAVTLADLGRVRINRNGTDEVNIALSMLSSIDNLKAGFVQATSTTGGSFAFTFVIPRHAWWDDQSGTYYGLDEAYIELSYPNVGTPVSSGTVSIFYNSAPKVSTYTTYLLQRNIQVGGAGQVAQDLEFKNISSLYIQADAAVTNLLVVSDGQEYANGSSDDLRNYSNLINRVESDLSLFEIDLNPFDEIRTDLNKETRLILNATGAVNYQIAAELYAPLAAQVVSKSIEDARKTPPSVAEDVSNA